MESSDVDGGSSVAVLTYLRHILEHIDNLDLTRLTLQYLFGLQRSVDYKRMPSTPLSRTRRRKSADLLTRFNDEGQPTPELFNLSALIFTSLKSDSQQTVTATLHILSAMLRGPHHQSLTSLLRTRPTSASDPRRTIGAHEKEIETLLSLAEDLTGFQDIEISYEQHIHDNRDNLESHPCSIELLNLPVTNQSATLFEPERTKLTQKVLKLEDPTFINLVALLDKYFKNDIETNLALTQVLVDLASCGYLRLELWLLSSPLTYQYPTDRKPVLSNGAPQMDEETSEIKLERLHQLRSTRLSPRILPESTSPLLQSLTRLTSIVSDFRRVITNFDSNLHICRGIIDLPSRQTTPILTPSRSPSRPPPAQATPIRKGHNLTTPILTPMTVSSRIITSNSSTRNVSPRGRQGKQEPEQGTSPSLISRLRYLQLSPSRTPLSQSSINTPSRSPFRDANPGLPFPLIPVTLWQRIRVEQQTQPRTSQVPDDEDSDTESDASSTVPDIGELSPTDVIATPSKSRHLAISTNSTARVRKHSNPSAGGRGRDGKYERKHVAINFNNEESDDSVDPKPFDTGLRTEPKNDGTVSLGHLLTNIIILQEFILELAAIVEVRGTLFEEVDL